MQSPFIINFFQILKFLLMLYLTFYHTFDHYNYILIRNNKKEINIFISKNIK